jgi:uncharacterized protein YndB with AHSA1/START domain
MISYEITATSITIASPERVFAVLDDFRHWPAWMPSMENIKVELPEGRQPGLGYRFRLRGLITHGDMEVVDFTPMSRATTFRISFPPFTGVNRCRLVPLPDGRHRIERIDTLDLPDLIAHLIDATQRRRFERLAGEFLDALKREVEGPPRA